MRTELTTAMQHAVCHYSCCRMQHIHACVSFVDLCTGARRMVTSWSVDSRACYCQPTRAPAGPRHLTACTLLQPLFCCALYHGELG